VATTSPPSPPTPPGAPPPAAGQPPRGPVQRARVSNARIVAIGALALVVLIIAYLVFVEFVTFGPLLIFLPLLARTRLEALRSYGTLVQQHNQLFHNKWIDVDRPANELPLGNPDMSSLVDLGSSFTVIRQMNIVPVGATQLVQVAIVSSLPALPLMFLVLPFMQVLKLLAGVVR